MTLKFNGGRGGAACDWCASTLVDGDGVVREHREIRAPGTTLHYCGWRCMEAHVDNDAGMHRARALLLARESERLRLIALTRPVGDILTRMLATLHSVEVKP